MKNILFAILWLFFSFQGFSQLNINLLSNTTYNTNLNDVWNYAANGREYALVGGGDALYILDITDPANPVDLGNAPGIQSLWRDVMTYGDRAFVTNDEGGGLLVIDLSNLPAPITPSDYYFWNPDIPGIGRPGKCHNIFIDENGIGYLAGCDSNSGGPVYVDLTDPNTVTYIDHAPAIYAHDVYTRGDLMYTSNIFIGQLRIYDVSNKANTVLLGTQNTPRNFTHNAWLNDVGDVAFTTDEKPNASVAAYDVSDPSDITLLDEFKPLSIDPNDGIMPHNVHVIGDYLVVSYYEYGVVIVDASVPDNLIEVGHYNTFSGNGFGAWGADPYLPSGNILVTDHRHGCFVLSPTYIRAARLHGNVKDKVTEMNINNVSVTIATTELHDGKTDFMGIYKTGLAIPGVYTVTYSATGYHSKTVTVTLTNGVITTQNIDLVPLGALDIDLISFEAKLINKKEVIVDWMALSNDDFIDFEIERSLNGVDFEKLGQVTDRTPSLSGKSYSFRDVSIPREVLLYRLKMIEPDGTFSYSTIKSVDNTNGETIEIGIFPNPVKAGKSIMFKNNSRLDTKDIQFQLFNSAGMQVAAFTFPENVAEINFDTHLLPRGVYFVKVMNDGIPLNIEKIVVN